MNEEHLDEPTRLQKIEKLRKELARLERMAVVADRAQNDMEVAMLGSALSERSNTRMKWKEWQRLRKTDPRAYDKASRTGRIAADLASMGRKAFYEEEDDQ